jgi:methionyl-tRNA formyltransferase
MAHPPADRGPPAPRSEPGMLAAMNIVFVTQDEPFFVPHFFVEFFAHLRDDRIKVSGIVIQAPLGNRSLARLMRQMLDFYGGPHFIRVGARYVGFKLMNAIAVGLFRGRFPGMFSVEHFLLKNHLGILRCEDVNSAAFVDRLRSLDLDLIVSVAASRKFGKELLSVARYGCINVHNSRLPRNRGMLPNFWSLYHYETEPVSGMTVHAMNDSLDDGPIVLQEDLRLDPAESLDSLIVRTKRLNAHLVLRALSLYHRGTPPLTPNDRAHATYNRFPTRADVERFRAKGLRLL